MSATAKQIIEGRKKDLEAETEKFFLFLEQDKERERELHEFVNKICQAQLQLPDCCENCLFKCRKKCLKAEYEKDINYRKSLKVRLLENYFRMGIQC